MKTFVNFVFVGFETFVFFKFFFFLLCPLVSIRCECYLPRFLVNLIFGWTYEEDLKVLTYQVLNHEWHVLFQIVVSCFKYSKAVVNSESDSFKLLVKLLNLLFKFILIQLHHLQSQSLRLLFTLTIY